MHRDEIRRTLRKLGVRPVKERGQNFLADPSALDKILEFGRARKGDNLLEIGPGLGVLSDELRHLGKLRVIEIEPSFCKLLGERYPQIEIIENDVMAVDFSEFGSDLIVFGNLPYSMSTDITFHLLSYASSLKRAVLLLQREFAARMAAQPGGKTFGALSLAAQLWSDVRLGPSISGSSFEPPARVESTLVELRFYDSPLYPVEDYFWFQRVVKAAFFKRRRKILNSIHASTFFKDVEIEPLLVQAGIDPEERAEQLSLEQYARLANIVCLYFRERESASNPELQP